MAVRRDRSPYFIPHETTEPLDFVLRDIDDATSDDEGDVIDLTGMTVTVVAWERDGTTSKTLAGTVSVVSPATGGTVRYTPADADDFDNFDTEAPYFIRWKVSDGTDHFYVPNGEDRDRWKIGR